jgi:hypothetical protein
MTLLVAAAYPNQQKLGPLAARGKYTYLGLHILSCNSHQKAE